MSQRFHDPSVDVVKGILILVIVAGHNEALCLQFQDVRKFFYYFNVQAFLLLVFCFPSRPFSLHLVVDRSIRYLYPYLLFVVVAALLHGLRGGYEGPFVQGFSAFAVGLFTGAEGKLELIAGLRLFWFLPTLFSLAMLRAVEVKYACAKPVFVLAGLTLIGVHALTDVIDLSVLPLGVGLALAFYPLGVFVEHYLASRLLRAHTLTRLMLYGMVAFCATYAIIVLVPLGWVSGASLEGVKWSTPATCMMALALPIISLPALFGFAQLLRWSRFLAFIGKGSLVIYLMHMFYYAALLELWKILGISFRESLFFGTITLLLTFGASAVSVAILDARPSLRRLIIPRDYWDLRQRSER